MAYTAYYQVTRLIGEVARVAKLAEKSAKALSTVSSFDMKEIRRNVKMVKQIQVEINDFVRTRFSGIESQCFYTGMLASLRITHIPATSLRDTDYTWVSRKRARTCWKNIRRLVADHFGDLAANDMYLTGDPYWLAVETRVWFEAWRNNLQVYFNT